VVNGKKTNMILDSGAQLSCIPEEFIREEDILIMPQPTREYDGKRNYCDKAMVNIAIWGLDLREKVIVIPKGAEPLFALKLKRPEHQAIEVDVIVEDDENVVEVVLDEDSEKVEGRYLEVGLDLRICDEEEGVLASEVGAGKEYEGVGEEGIEMDNDSSEGVANGDKYYYI